MSASPHCIKCGDYIHHGKVVCEPCFFNVETAHKSDMDVQSHRLRETNAELLEALKLCLPDTHGDFGGPLVQAKAFFEDGSEHAISPETYTKARAIKAKAEAQ